MKQGWIGLTHSAIAMACTVYLGAAQAQDAEPVFADDDPARIWIDGDALHFHGALSIASQDAFLNLIATEDTSGVKHFVINSLGGDTNTGRVIGLWIHDQAAEVVIDAICFSSCANYVFPAGTARTIRAASFVGWHGSETQYDVIALSTPGKSGEDLEREALRAALIPALPEGATGDIIDQAVDRQIEYATISRQDEAFFFDKLGLSGEFTLHGLRPSIIDAWRESGRAGWTYTLSDMEKFGLGPVTFLGEGAYATSRQVERNVFVAPFDAGRVTE